MNNKKNKNNHSGFTLIELLVVISIIGILSSFAVVSLNSARVKARDALRKGDMAQIRTALGLYYMDHNRYPECSDTWDDTLPDYGANTVDGSDCYIWLGTQLTAGARPIMERIPMDPQNNDNTVATDPVHIYRYVTDSGGTQYAVVYRLEEEADITVFRGW